MVRIPEHLLEAIRQYGERTYPHECCGFLLGTWEGDVLHVQQIKTIENAYEETARTRRYLIRPEDYIQTEREALEQGLDIVGTFHSHPDHPARPSVTDLAEATFPDFLYMIVSVYRGHARELTAWKLAPDRETFESVTINQEVLP